MTEVEQGRRHGRRGAPAAPCYVRSHFLLFYYPLLVVNLLIYSIKTICTKAREGAAREGAARVQPGGAASVAGGSVAGKEPGSGGAGIMRTEGRGCKGVASVTVVDRVLHSRTL